MIVYGANKQLVKSENWSKVFPKINKVITFNGHVVSY